MNKTIKVPMQLTQQDKFVSIPISYTVEKGNEMVTVYNCKVDLPAADIPEWLTLDEFSIRKVYHNTITSHSISPKFINGIDTALFLNAAMEQIRFREQYENNLIKLTA